MNAITTIQAALWYEAPAARQIASAIVALTRITGSITDATWHGQAARNAIGSVTTQPVREGLAHGWATRMVPTGVCKELWDRLSEIRDEEIAVRMAEAGFSKNWFDDARRDRVEAAHERFDALGDEVATVADAVAAAFEAAAVMGEG